MTRVVFSLDGTLVDSERWFQMGRAVGVRSLSVAWGYYPAVELRVAGAAAILESFEDLPEALEDIRVNEA